MNILKPIYIPTHKRKRLGVTATGEVKTFKRNQNPKKHRNHKPKKHKKRKKRRRKRDLGKEADQKNIRGKAR